MLLNRFASETLPPRGMVTGEKSAVFEGYFTPFIRLLNHYPVTIPPLPRHYPEGTLLGTPMGIFASMLHRATRLT